MKKKTELTFDAWIKDSPIAFIKPKNIKGWVKVKIVLELKK